MPVVGVVKDFKQQSLREVIRPIAISPKIKYYQSAGIKLSGKNLLASNKEIQVIWDKYFPEYVYNSSFLDESINRYYKQEQRLSLLYKVYAALAIFISCLGLYGLVLSCRSKNKRGWNKESIRCKCSKPGVFIFKGIYHSYIHCIYTGSAGPGI